MSGSAEPAPPAGCVLDEALRGRLALWQPIQGYRFSIDAFLLADFAKRALPERGGRLVDLGAGCGVVGLALARDSEAQLTLVELQPRLAELCRINARHNGLADRVEVVQGDLRQLGPERSASVELVVSNPPFRAADSGRHSPDPEKAVANTELELTLPELVSCAARLLRPRGALAVIYPAERAAEVLAVLLQHSLQPVRLRPVYPRPERPARRVLVQARKGGGHALVIEPPLIVQDHTEAYAEEVSQLLGEPPV
ncbi:MAG: methyltransferase [bacterium]